MGRAVGQPAAQGVQDDMQFDFGQLSDLSVRLQELEVGCVGVNELGLGSARLSLVNALEGFRSSRYRLGQKLSAYKAFFQANQGWMVAATAIADAMGCEERTIRRIIDDFERVSEVPDVVIKALQQAGFDPAARKNAGMIAKLLGMPDKPADLDLDIAVTEAALATKVAEQIGRSRGAVAAALIPPRSAGDLRSGRKSAQHSLLSRQIRNWLNWSLR